MKRKLFKHQRTALERFANSPYFMLDFEPGTGKTTTAIEIAKKKNKNVIVIAPKNLIKTWQDELAENGVDEEDVFVFDGAKERKDKEAYLKLFEDFIR